MSLQYKPRRLWRPALATHPRTTSRLSISCGFRGAGPISWNPLQAAKQRSCGYNMIPHPYRSPKGDWHINYDVEDDSRSRFAEPREDEVMPIAWDGGASYQDNSIGKMHKVQERRCAMPYSFENLDWLPYLIDSHAWEIAKAEGANSEAKEVLKTEPTAEKRKAFILRWDARQRRIGKAD